MTGKDELIAVAQYDTDDTHADEALRKLRIINPTYHRCYDWGHVICNEDEPEWFYCNCEIKNI
jgi:hypothetical protein